MGKAELIALRLITAHKHGFTNVSVDKQDAVVRFRERNRQLERKR